MEVVACLAEANQSTNEPLRYDGAFNHLSKLLTRIPNYLHVACSRIIFSMPKWEGSVKTLCPADCEPLSSRDCVFGFVGGCHGALH